MANSTTEIFASIGAMQTLVENFPMGVLTSKNVKNYESSLEFLVDSLRVIGINDKELLSFILEKLIGLNDDKIADHYDEKKLSNNKFITGLENSIKNLIAHILANIVSCSVWPKIPAEAIDRGFDLPISLIDPMNILNTCPTSLNGKYLYDKIGDSKPQDLSSATDMNAFIWYCINEGEPLTGNTWVNHNTEEKETVCTVTNRGFKKIRIQIGENYRELKQTENKEKYVYKTLYKFNKDYLKSITILSPKAIVLSLLDELTNGIPNIEGNFGITDTYYEAVIEKLVDKVITNDDLEINDCYYTFSNDDWTELLEKTELKKYNAKKSGSDTSSAVVIDKSVITNALNNVSTATTLHDRSAILSDAIFSASTIETERLVSEGGTKREVVFDYDYNSQWLYNLLIGLTRPIMKCVMTPKVMCLLAINYEIAGAVNLSQINTDNTPTAILDFLMTKMQGLLATLIKKVKDDIVDAVLSLFNAKIAPLVTKYNAAKLKEELDYYLELLLQAIECIQLFGNKSNGLTSIDEVNYADITPTKNNPEKTIC